MMENLIQIHSVKNVLSHSGCPEDLLESYLQFLQAGGHNRCRLSEVKLL